MISVSLKANATARPIFIWLTRRKYLEPLPDKGDALCGSAYSGEELRQKPIDETAKAFIWHCPNAVCPQ